MGTKTRINITMDEETLRLADRAARRRKSSRSEFIRVAVREIAANHQRESEDAARRKRQREAIEIMDRLAHKAGDWPAEEILRAWRRRGENKQR